MKLFSAIFLVLITTTFWSHSHAQDSKGRDIKELIKLANEKGEIRVTVGLAKDSLNLDVGNTDTDEEREAKVEAIQQEFIKELNSKVIKDKSLLSEIEERRKAGFLSILPYVVLTATAEELSAMQQMPIVKSISVERQLQIQ